jgi:hypothetical protein
MTREDIIALALAGKQNLRDRISYAIDLEREACAKVCDKLGDEYADTNAADCAFAIRERGAP